MPRKEHKEASRASLCGTFGSHNFVFQNFIIAADMNELEPREAPGVDDLMSDSATGTFPFNLLAARHAAYCAALALLAIALWCFTHRYRGLVGDSELYAVPALSRIRNGLANDVFLKNASQDSYTIFSPIYAFFIKHLGLSAAAISLLVFSKLCFYCSAWALSRKLSDSRTALLTTVLLIVTPIEYGAYHVFHVAEDMLTARSVAEALAMAGLCLHVYDRRNAGLAIATLALSIHALMALPMVLLLMSLRVGWRRGLLVALAAVVFAPMRRLGRGNGAGAGS